MIHLMYLQWFDDTRQDQDLKWSLRAFEPVTDEEMLYHIFYFKEPYGNLT